jgi:hypothetical protein
MYCTDLWLVKAVMDRNVEEARRLARLDSLAHGARAVQPGWLSRQGGGILSQLGARLVILGERLEQYIPVRPAL